MDDEFIDYGELIDEAMHLVVRRALERVARAGLPGDHHFFITFATRHPGVMIGEELRKRYPEEMTIVIQHQYWDLEIEEDRFSLVLSFDNVKQNLTIPFDALVSFADPSVKFGLQFNMLPISANEDGLLPAQRPGGIKATMSDGSNVVSLDSFRKK